MTALVGTFAAILTTGAWLPQLIRSWRSRSTGDLSWGYLGMTGLGISSWLIYGVLKADWALIASNAITVSLILALSAVKLVSANRSLDVVIVDTEALSDLSV